MCSTWSSGPVLTKPYAWMALIKQPANRDQNGLESNLLLYLDLRDCRKAAGFRARIVFHTSISKGTSPTPGRPPAGGTRLPAPHVSGPRAALSSSPCLPRLLATASRIYDKVNIFRATSSYGAAEIYPGTTCYDTKRASFVENVLLEGRI